MSTATPKQDAFPGCFFAAVAIIALAGIFACLVLPHTPGSEKSPPGKPLVGSQKPAGGLFEQRGAGVPHVEQSFFHFVPREEVRLAKSPSRLLKTAAAVIVEERK